jgi:phenylacetate-coenzyme A ligase PaaK-like adenylate-forming protein
MPHVRQSISERPTARRVRVPGSGALLQEGPLKTFAGARAALERRQIDKFRRLVAHASRASPYYAEIIKANGISVATCTPSDFPLLTKDEAIRHFDRIVTTPAVTRSRVEHFLRGSTDPFELFDGQYVVVTSSGTSGLPGISIYSAAEFAAGMKSARLIPMPAFDAARKIRIAYVGVVTTHRAALTMLGNLLRADNRARFELLTVSINKSWQDIVDTLNDFRPDGLAAYASALRELADRKASGELNVNPVFLEAFSEVLTKIDRAAIEHAFAAPLLNIYGSGECLQMGFGWRDDAMSLFEDNLIFELGEDYTAVTNLFNHTMPLIRYRFDDVLIKADQQAGKSPYIKIREVIGRSEFDLHLENDLGRRETVSSHALLSFNIFGLKQYQLIVTGTKRFKIRVCFERHLGSTERHNAKQHLGSEVAHMLRTKQMSKVEFFIEEVPELPVDSQTGKFRYVCYA